MSEQTPEMEKLWHDLFTDPDHPVYRHARRHERFWRHIPGDPRCKMCKVPLGGVASPVLRMTSKAPSPNNPRFCNSCNTWTKQHPGGAEVEMSIMFADVRGSTPLAEEIGTPAFVRLMQRFYEVGNRVLVESHGWIDKPVGDEVRALYLPVFTPNHAEQAIRGARELLVATGHDEPEGPWLPVGAGVHTGSPYVGTVGVEGTDEYDVTVLGDAVNVTARLASVAAAGEILISDEALGRSKLDLPEMEARTLELKGRVAPLDVHVLTMGDND